MVTVPTSQWFTIWSQGVEIRLISSPSVPSHIIVLFNCCIHIKIFLNNFLDQFTLITRVKFASTDTCVPKKKSETYHLLYSRKCKLSIETLSFFGLGKGRSKVKYQGNVNIILGQPKMERNTKNMRQREYININLWKRV